MVDYAQTLNVTPTRILPKRISRNAFVYEFEDGRTSTKNLSVNKYDAELQWDYISAADLETILDWYHDSTKANGMARTFYWDDPRSGETYEARFLGPLKTVFVPGNLQSIDKIPVRLIKLIYVTAANLISSTTISEPIISMIEAVNASDSTSQSTISEPTVQLIKAVNATNNTSQSTIDEPNISVSAAAVAVNSENIASSATISEPTILPIRAINVSNNTSQSIISEPSINTGGIDINAENNTSQTTISEPTIQPARAINVANNITQANIGEPTVEVIAIVEDVVADFVLDINVADNTSQSTVSEPTLSTV